LAQGNRVYTEEDIKVTAQRLINRKESIAEKKSQNGQPPKKPPGYRVYTEEDIKVTAQRLINRKESIAEKKSQNGQPSNKPPCK
jgi:DNA-binding transcriptional MerR regulator